VVHVVIAGAGPTGLTAAVLLRGLGLETRVVDKLAEPGKLAKAMVLWSRSLEILDEIGVAEEAVRQGTPLVSARYLDSDRPVAEIVANRIKGTRWMPVILPQDRLEAILRERYAELGGVVEWDTEVVDATDRFEGVLAELAGPGGARTQAACDYLLGCDGLRSAVRTIAGIPWEEGPAYEETFQLGDVRMDTALDRGAAHHFLGRTGVSVALPMPDGLWRVVGYLDGQKPEGRVGKEELQELLTACGHEGSTIHEVFWSGQFTVLRRLATTFRAGRILLAGDAAHVHSPAGGQGLNTGLQDAHNLAWKLGLVAKGLAGEELLDSYTAERRPIAASILKVTRMQDERMFGARSRTSRAVRNTAMRTLARTGVLERRLIPDLAQILVDYRDSPLSAGSGRRGAPVRAGRRVAPEVFQPAGGQLALLLTGGEPSPELIALADEFAGTVALEAAPEALTELAGAPRRPQVVGVRPDGHVGYRGPADQVEALRGWLRESVRLVPAPRQAAFTTP
jgi:2-polyprenyl-6-methoxyphenol hydroxylase-like FAD-dependent oxidoreductase